MLSPDNNLWLVNYKILEIPILVARYDALRNIILRDGFCKAVTQQAAGKRPHIIII